MKYFSKKRELIILLLLLQIFIVLFILIFTLKSDPWFEYYPKLYTFLETDFFITVMTLAGGIFGIISIFLVLEFIRLLEKEIQHESIKNQFEELRNTNFMLREQKHDFKNHIQVILGFVQLKKYDYVEKYIKDVIKETDIEKKEICGINAPADIKALLANKFTLAKQKNIKFKVKIHADILNYDINTFDLTRILSNLLSNAFYAVENCQKYEKSVLLSVWENKTKKNKRKLIIKVINTGETIPIKNHNKIFRPGFTTKGQNGDGMGLHIVNKLTLKNGGQIELRSNNKSTVFILIFTKTPIYKNDLKNVSVLT